MVNILKDFRVINVAREKSTQVPLNTIPTEIPTLLANVAMVTPSIINANVRPVSITLMIALNRFVFFNKL